MHLPKYFEFFVKIPICVADNLGFFLLAEAGIFLRNWECSVMKIVEFFIKIMSCAADYLGFLLSAVCFILQFVREIWCSHSQHGCYFLF